MMTRGIKHSCAGEDMSMWQEKGQILRQCTLGDFGVYRKACSPADMYRMALLLCHSCSALSDD